LRKKPAQNRGGKKRQKAATNLSQFAAFCHWQLPQFVAFGSMQLNDFQYRSTLARLPLFDPDFNNFQCFGFRKWRVCKGCPARKRSKGLVVQTYPVPIGGVLCIIMSHHVSQTFIPS
jgi:hypothetical protein